MTWHLASASLSLFLKLRTSALRLDAMFQCHRIKPTITSARIAGKLLKKTVKLAYEANLEFSCKRGLHRHAVPLISASLVQSYYLKRLRFHFQAYLYSYFGNCQADMLLQHEHSSAKHQELVLSSSAPQSRLAFRN
jgi:hypothetical protein